MICQLNIINEKKYSLINKFKVKLVEIIRLVEEKISLNNLAWLEINKLLKAKPEQKKWQLNLILIDEKESQQLNQQYRQKNYPANALTFPFARFYQKELDTCEELGDIFLCYPLIQKQIQKIYQKEKTSQSQCLLKREICFLFMHGIIHLFGCDHKKEVEKQLIFALQEEIIDLLTEQEKAHHFR